MSKKIEIKKHLMTAISFFLPIVVASGFLLAIGNMMGGTTIADWGVRLLRTSRQALVLQIP